MKKTKILLSAGIASAFAVAILYIAGIHTKDAPVQPQSQAAATCTHDHAKEPIVLQKLEAHLTAQLPVAKAYPDIANDPEAVAAMQLKRLQAVFPELTAFPANWKNFSPKEVLIAPYEDIQIPFQLDTAKTVKAAEGEDRLVQIYRNGMQGGYAVTAATSDEILTIVTVPGSDIFEIHVNKDNEVTVTTAPNADCGTQEPPKKAAHVPTHAAMVAAAQQVEMPVGVLQSGSNHVSNVVFFYNQATLDNFSTSGTNILPTNPTTLETRYIAHVEAANITLSNSDIPLEWNYVGAFQMPEFQLISDRELREPDGSLVPNADSPLHNGIEILGNYSFNIIDARNQEAYNFAMAKIEEVKADQSVFIAQIWPNRQGIAGLAWTGWKGSPARAASVRTNANYNTLAHELGHNFGCLHDRSTENLPDSAEYNYGFIFLGNDQGWENTKIGTIMSYASRYIPYFSSPLLTFTDDASVTVTIGVAEGQYGAADNARYMRETAPDMPINRNPPVILTHPQDVEIAQNASFTLTVSASGNDMTYAWYHNGVQTSTTTAIYTNYGTVLTSGTYVATISNKYGNVTSNPAVVTVTPILAPVILTHPQDVTVTAGATFTLSVAASGTNLTYQWYKGGVAITNAKSTTYTKNNSATSDSGFYTVVVSNPGGDTNSQTATVTVNPPPQPPSITSHPQNVTVTEGSSFTVSITASGTGLSYQWKKAGANIAGATSSSYTKTNSVTTDSGAYTCTVTNDVGSKTSNAATVTVNAAGKPPVINSQPQSITVAQGNTFTLAVTASGAGLSYQWKKNGANIAGATSRTYSKVAATTDNGNYTVTISNAYGNVTSSAVTVTVTTSGGNTGGNNNSSSGGGGGGGAPSLLYVLGLGATALIKRLIRR